MILHVGDVSNRETLNLLAEIAPLHAVQGNRDWFLGLKLPSYLSLDLNGVRITLTHGHLNLPRYLCDLFRFIILRHEVVHTYYQNLLAEKFPECDLFVYGHTHYQVDEIMNQQRFINPGAAYPCGFNNHQAQYALLRISPSGEIASSFHTSD